MNQTGRSTQAEGLPQKPGAAYGSDFSCCAYFRNHLASGWRACTCNFRNLAPEPCIFLQTTPPLQDAGIVIFITVKGSRHLTFNITVKLTIKEEMLNLTCRQTFIHSSKAWDWLVRRAHAVGRKPPTSQLERAALCLRRSR